MAHGGAFAFIDSWRGIRKLRVSQSRSGHLQEGGPFCLNGAFNITFSEGYLAKLSDALSVQEQ
jgi:hypothetical protein